MISCEKKEENQFAKQSNVEIINDYGILKFINRRVWKGFRNLAISLIFFYVAILRCWELLGEGRTKQNWRKRFMNENVHLKKSEKWYKKESQKHLQQKEVNFRCLTRKFVWSKSVKINKTKRCSGILCIQIASSQR